MSAPKTLSHRIALSEARSQVFFTDLQLQVFAVTHAYVPITQALLAEYPKIVQMEAEHSDAIDKARVSVVIADTGLNQFCDKVSATVLSLVAGNRRHPLYTVFFGKKSLSVFKRPLLGSQLSSMYKWAVILATSEHASLKALAPELDTLLVAADAAVDAQAVAEQANKVFREVGERRKFIDGVNAGRKSLYGELSTLPHKVVGLPAGFADQFFRRDSTDAADPAEPTIEEVQAKIDALAKELSAQQGLLKQLEVSAGMEALPA
jgi:hypothetical protein